MMMWGAWKKNALADKSDQDVLLQRRGVVGEYTTGEYFGRAAVGLPIEDKEHHNIKGRIR